MRNVIHLTDFHVGDKGNGTRLIAIIDHLIANYTNAAAPNVVVVTGDLVDELTTDQTTVDDLVFAKKQLERLEHFEVHIVPGNHDYGYGNLQFEGSMEKFRDVIYPAPPNFPILSTVGTNAAGGAEFALIGIDSMLGEMISPFDHDQLGADGALGDDQMTRLRAKLNDPTFTNATHRIVYLHHHPFMGLIAFGLKDRRAFQRAITGKNVDLLLFGHRHKAKVFCGKNQELDIPMTICGGSSCVGKHPIFHVIDFNGEKLTATKITLYGG